MSEMIRQVSFLLVIFCHITHTASSAEAPGNKICGEHAFFNTTLNICQCQKYYKKIDGKCVSHCYRTAECPGLHVSCNTQENKCVCDDGYTMDIRNECQQIAGYCFSDNDCINEHEFCDKIDHICKCFSGYTKVKNTCVKQKHNDLTIKIIVGVLVPFVIIAFAIFIGIYFYRRSKEPVRTSVQTSSDHVQYEEHVQIPQIVPNEPPGYEGELPEDSSQPPPYASLFD